MMQYEQHKSGEKLLSTMSLEEVLPRYLQHTACLKYRACDLLERLEEGNKITREVIGDYSFQAAADGKRLDVMQLVENLMGPSLSLETFCQRVICEAEDVLNRYGIDYTAEPHPMKPEEVILKIECAQTAEGFETFALSSYSGYLHTPRALPVTLGLLSLSLMIKDSHELEAIVSQSALFWQTAN